MTRSLSLLLLRCAILVSAIHRSNDHGRHAIANGDEQGPTMSVYQYFTLLSDTTSGKGTKRCSGTLIHEDIVATSANCIYQEFVRNAPVQIIARADYRSDSFARSIHYVVEIVNHPGFSPNSLSLTNDLAILRLNTTADVAVPMLNNLNLPTDDGDNLDVLGAGATVNGSSVWSTVLVKDDIFTTDFIMCRNDYRAKRANLKEESQFCAGIEGRASGPCNMADHGGAIVNMKDSNNASAHILMGITSFGDGCAASSLPYVFTRVKFYYDWITLQICRLAKSPPTYCITNMPSSVPSVSPSTRPTSSLNHPYFVLLTPSPNGNNSTRCGGTLIHSDIVLTAANCAKVGYYALVGYNEKWVPPLALRQVVAIRNHPGYAGSSSALNYPNNLALVRLDNHVDNVWPIRVNNVSAVPPDNGAEVIFVGAGDTTSEDSELIVHDVVMSDTFYTSNFRFCSETYKQTGLIALNEAIQFCAGIDGVAAGPCGEGDYGGPLIIKGSTANDDIQVGIAVPPSVGCGESDPPSIFTRVAAYATWIRREVCFFSASGPDYCITSSPSESPSEKPTPQPTDKPTLAPTTEPPTPIPTLPPTIPPPPSPPPTPVPTTSSPTTVPTQACQDLPGDVLFVIDGGMADFRPCSWLNENPDEKETYCALDHLSNGAILCEETCRLCTDPPSAAPVPPTEPPSHIPSMSPTSCVDEQGNPIQILIGQLVIMTFPCSWLEEAQGRIDSFCPLAAGAHCPLTCGLCEIPPTPVPSAMPTPKPTVVPTPEPTGAPTPTKEPTPAPTVPCEDTEGQFFFIFEGVASLESCRFLIDNPEFLDTECANTSVSRARDVCPLTCGVCTR